MNSLGVEKGRKRLIVILGWEWNIYLCVDVNRGS